MQRNPRGPYLESFAIFTKLKTSMQAAWGPQSLATPLPLLTPAKAVSAAPWPGLQCAWGLSGGRGWWRRPRRASTWRQRLLPPSGRKLRVHPQAGPLMGSRFGKLNGEGAAGPGASSEGGVRGPGPAPRPESSGPKDRQAPRGPDARARGASPVFQPWGPSVPRTEDRRLNQEAAGKLGTRARTPHSTAAASLPPSPSRVPFSPPYPHPPRGRGHSLVIRSGSLQILQICSNGP